MTDRVSGLFVIFEDDIRVDDLDIIKNAIMMFRGIIGVENIPASAEERIAEMRVRQELRTQLREVLK